MTQIRKANEENSLGHIDVPQGQYRSQIDALTDAVRQLGGNPVIEPGASVVNDPLNAPYVLYVNSYTGRDTFVTGDYATADDGTFAQQVRRISNQRLECGYTEARPFRTINRAIIEAGIITSRSYLDADNGLCAELCDGYDGSGVSGNNGDLVSIVVAPGVHLNINGNGADSIVPWTDGYEPTKDDLEKFNPGTGGGVILPRGCSLISLDLRKTIVSPDFVPDPRYEGDNYERRHAMFRLTGGCYVYGMTFIDKIDEEKSHHLLDVFQFASEAQLDEFYDKIVKAFPDAAFINPGYANRRNGESEIVGPQPAVPTEKTDTVGSASPYLYNISNRSVYGLCGLFANGDAVTGFKSCVIAQYTGVSLQKDMSVWQIYKNGSWGTLADYDEYMNADPNDLRTDPRQRSIHIRAVNKSVIQEVSVFAIGQAIHHAVASGGEITITNSNSNWGGCAALAEGFHETANPIDVGHTITEVIAPLDPIEGSAVRKIGIGSLKDGLALDTTVLEFDEFGASTVFLDAGYTLPANDNIWVTNPYGDDFYGKVVSYDFDGDDDSVTIAGQLMTPAGDDGGTGMTVEEVLQAQFGDLISVEDFLQGQQVYIRRMQDRRAGAEKAVRFVVDSPALSRRPVRDYVPVENGGALPDQEIASVLTIGGPEGEDGDYLMQLRYAKRADIDYSLTVWYHPGDTIIKDGKHLTAIKSNYGEFNEEDWDESFVHMPEDFTPEGYFKNLSPTVLIDGDTDENDSETLGITTLPASSLAQIRNAIDYVGAQIYLRQVGLGTIDIDPTTEDNRRKDVNKVTNFHRPSNIRLYSHAFEWAGFQNYTKAVPKYQLDLSATNKFTYYFTNKDGGRVYCSGFNEEGQAVTNAGLQDFETGSAIAFDEVGNGDLSAIDILEPDIPRAGKDSLLGGRPSGSPGVTGIINVASKEQCQTVLFDNLNVNVSNSAEGWRAVEVNDLETVRDYVKQEINNSREDLGILPDEHQSVYIHSDVVRTASEGIAEYASLPQKVIDEFDYNQSIHGGNHASAYIDPEDPSKGRLIQLLSFPSLGMALRWLKNRAPISAEVVKVMILDNGLSGGRVKDSALLNWEFNFKFAATKQYRLRGPNIAPTYNPEDYAGYLKPAPSTLPSAATLSIRNCTIHVGEAPGRPDRVVNKYNWFIRSRLEIHNCILRARSSDEQVMFMAAEESSYVVFKYDSEYQQMIWFDQIATGTTFDSREGHTDVRIGKSEFITQQKDVLPAGQTWVNTVDNANRLRFRLCMNVIGPGDTRNHQIEFWNNFIHLRRTADNRRNNELNIQLDFTNESGQASSATKLEWEGPIENSYWRCDANGWLTCQVLNEGNLQRAIIFKCSSWNKQMQLGTIVDDASYSLRYPTEKRTFSGVIAEEFADCLPGGKSAVDVAVRDDRHEIGLEQYNKGWLEPYNIYNGIFYGDQMIPFPQTSGFGPNFTPEHLNAEPMPEDDD